jgi:hypothetical protein
VTSSRSLSGAGVLRLPFFVRPILSSALFHPFVPRTKKSLCGIFAAYALLVIPSSTTAPGRIRSAAAAV